MSEKETKNTETMENKDSEKVIEFPKQDGIKVEIVDQVYRLDEMADAMDQSIENAKHVAKEQAALIRVINKSEEAKNFVEFVKAEEQQIEEMNNQITTLSIRSGLLREIVKICKDDEKISKVVSMTLKALGVFERN